MAERSTTRRVNRFDVVSNPDTQEGAAIDDFMAPNGRGGPGLPRASGPPARAVRAFPRSRDKSSHDVRSAELKVRGQRHAATTIIFMHELATWRSCSAPNRSVAMASGRIRATLYFLYLVCYGAPSSPRTCRLWCVRPPGVKYEPQLLNSVEEVNKRQKEVLPGKINKHFGGKLAGKTFAVWGLAFKPGTDDMREAPSRVLLEALWKGGAKVRAYDPAAAKEARRIWGERPDLTLCSRSKDTLEGDDALVIVHRVEGISQPGFRCPEESAQAVRSSSTAGISTTPPP